MIGVLVVEACRRRMNALFAHISVFVYVPLYWRAPVRQARIQHLDPGGSARTSSSVISLCGDSPRSPTQSRQTLRGLSLVELYRSTAARRMHDIMAFGVPSTPCCGSKALSNTQRATLGLCQQHYT